MRSISLATKTRSRMKQEGFVPSSLRGRRATLTAFILSQLYFGSYEDRIDSHVDRRAGRCGSGVVHRASHALVVHVTGRSATRRLDSSCGANPRSDSVRDITVVGRSSGGVRRRCADGLVSRSYVQAQTSSIRPVIVSIAPAQRTSPLRHPPHIVQQLRRTHSPARQSHYLRVL